jgi:Flp pilus assembly protein TadG
MSANRPRRREHGAVVTVVAVLLAGGVLMGFLALSLDVGQVLVEKRQLQNSADAAAVSLAQSCAKSNCVAGADSLANLVDNNANDKVSGIQAQCSANMPGSTLPACGTSSGTWADCSPLPPALAAMTGLPYVEVRTRTQTANGAGRDNSMRNWIAGLNGNSTTIAAGACARAAVGTPAEVQSELPVTFSACDWQHATGGTTGGGGGSYYPSPVYNGSNTVGYGGAGQPPWPTAAATPPAQIQGQEVILLAQNPPGGATLPTGCPNWSGHALPGGFGILETTSDPCVFVEYPFHWMHTDTGNQTGCDLSALVGKVINLPIFDCTNDSAPGQEPPVNGCTTGNGSNAYYHRAGYAQFYLSGYALNVSSGIPNKAKSLVSNQFPCSGGDRCISGWFLKGELSSQAISGPPSGSGNFGTYAVVPAG